MLLVFVKQELLASEGKIFKKKFVLSVTNGVSTKNVVFSENLYSLSNIILTQKYIFFYLGRDNSQTINDY